MNEQDQQAQSDPLVVALTHLRTLPSFQLVIEHVIGKREVYIKSLNGANTGKMAMKHAGSLLAMDDLIDFLRGD